MAGAVWEAEFAPGLFVAWLRAPRLASRARGAAGEPGCNVARVSRQEGAAERPPAADGGRGDATHAPRGRPGSRQRAWPARLLLRLLRDQKSQGNRLHLSAQGPVRMLSAAPHVFPWLGGRSHKMELWPHVLQSLRFALSARTQRGFAQRPQHPANLRAQQAGNTRTVLPF